MWVPKTGQPETIRAAVMIIKKGPTIFISLSFLGGKGFRGHAKNPDQ
jgi:hypothetical protein